MFTGLIEEVGRLEHRHKQGKFAQLRIHADRILADVQLGDSIAVNGVCLTVTALGARFFCADVMEETLNRTTLGHLPLHSPLNLERAMAANGRFGGHMVSGHIDGKGKILSITAAHHAVWFRVQAPAPLMRYIIEKGAVTLDGISLTVVDVEPSSFRVSVIPHTLSHTNLVSKNVGDEVNIENDMLAKYLEKLLGNAPLVSQRGITPTFLAEVGF